MSYMQSGSITKSVSGWHEEDAQETWADHCDVGVLLDEVSDVCHLRLEVGCPYIPYS